MAPRNLSDVCGPVLIGREGVTLVGAAHAVRSSSWRTLRAPCLPFTGVLWVTMAPKSLHARCFSGLPAFEGLSASDILPLQAMNFGIQFRAYCLFCYKK